MRVVEAYSIYGENIKIDMDYDEGLASGRLGAILMPLTPDCWTVIVETDDGAREEINCEDFFWGVMAAEADYPNYEEF